MKKIVLGEGVPEFRGMHPGILDAPVFVRLWNGCGCGDDDIVYFTVPKDWEDRDIRYRLVLEELPKSKQGHHA